MLTVYILKLENNKFYIGRTTKNVYDRVLEHSNGDAGYWTQIHKPLELFDFKPNADKFDTDLYVKKYMDRYGISNVRGGTYSSPILSTEKYNIITAELATANFRKPKTKNKQYNNCRTDLNKNQSCIVM